MQVDDLSDADQMINMRMSVDRQKDLFRVIVQNLLHLLCIIDTRWPGQRLMAKNDNPSPVSFMGVMVSSTFTDLEQHRAAVIKAIDGQELKVRRNGKRLGKARW